MLQGSTRFEWNHMVWFSQLHITWSKRKQCTTAVAVFQMTNKDCGAHEDTRAANSEGIWNNYVYIQQKIMQVRFIILLCTQENNSLVDPTKQHDVWRKTCLGDSKLVAHKDWQFVDKKSFRLNPLQCCYLFNIQFNYWFSLLGNNIILFF